MGTDKRIPASAIGSVAALILAAWIGQEGFSPGPIIPTQGDVPTIGHGSTEYEDGRRVTMADPPITRVRAAALAEALLDRKFGACVRASLGDTPVHLVEMKLAVDFAGQYGCAGWQGSAMLARTRTGDYAGACQAYLAYRFMTSARQEGPGWVAYRTDATGKPIRWRFDCSTPGNRICRGVWTRQLQRHTDCMAAQA